MPTPKSTQIEQSFAKDFLSLKAIFEFIGKFSVDNKLDDGQSFSIKFAVEEVFTNMVKYNPGTNDVLISLKKDREKIEVGLVDVEKKPFDITKHEEVNPNLPIEQRRPGGLGVFLVKKLMDRVDYTHDGVHSRITLTKFVE